MMKKESIKICTGCGHLSNKPIAPSYLGCCPDNNYVPCPHENKVKKVLQVYCTCEVTAVFCQDCGEQLTEEQWEV